MKSIYLDHAAATPVSSKVLVAMQPYFSQFYGNPSESHQWGQQARSALDQAREEVADFLGAKPSEIIFTSGATEAINLAHKGLVESQKQKLPHVITSSIEHPAVLETCRHLESLNLAKVTYLSVDKNGVVNVKDLQKAILPETILISLIYVNNETGAIQPVAEIGSLLKKINARRSKKIYFHTDATQAIQYLNCDVDFLGVDLLSLSGHKFYAPKGVGVLFLKKGTPLIRQQDGGGQEYRLRSGTENIPAIVGLGKAIELITQGKEAQNKKIKELKEKLIIGVLKIPGIRLLSQPQFCAPHIATFLVKDVEGEAMLLLLSQEGVAVSSGSACTSGLLKASHVLLAMGYQPQEAHGSLRFSLGAENTPPEIEKVIKILPGIIKKLRRMAPKL